MPVALITPENLLKSPDGPHVRMLEEAGFEVRYPEDTTFTRGLYSDEDTVKVLSVADAVIAGGEYFKDNILANLPKLRVIARAGVGYDKVDVAAATKHGVALTITPTANHEAVAEHALSLLFAVAKSTLLTDRAARDGEWPMTLTQPVRGKTCGIYGLGRIGRSMAVRVKALGMRVIASDPFADAAFVKEHGIELVDFDTMLTQSDYVSVHCPLTPETKGQFNKDAFAKMKPGSIFINTARGGMQVEADLIEALQSGHLFGAGLDVFEKEPTSADNPLFQLDNVVATPHLAGGDVQSQEDMGIEAADSIIKLHRGEWPGAAVVNKELEGNWKW